MELGRIEKPSVESFSAKRKLYIVRNFPSPASTDEYKKLVHKYWDEVFLQIGKIEAAGKVKKIFCEHIFSGDDLAVEKMAGKRAAELIREKASKGAILYPLEKEEIYNSLIDWRNCLQVVVTREVFERVLEFYKETLSKRLEHVREVIEQNLDKEESGLLITTEEDATGFLFSEDIELFFVRPPSYDDILRHVREETNKKKEEEEKEDSQ
jgi:hypothetical protein